MTRSQPFPRIRVSGHAGGFSHTNAEIAAHLYLSEATVKSHVTHLFDKLTVTNRVQLAIAAFRAGLVS